MIRERTRDALGGLNDTEVTHSILKSRFLQRRIRNGLISEIALSSKEYELVSAFTTSNCGCAEVLQNRSSSGRKSFKIEGPVWILNSADKAAAMQVLCDRQHRAPAAPRYIYLVLLQCTQSSQSIVHDQKWRHTSQQ